MTVRAGKEDDGLTLWEWIEIVGPPVVGFSAFLAALAVWIVHRMDNTEDVTARVSYFLTFLLSWSANKVVSTKKDH